MPGQEHSLAAEPIHQQQKPEEQATRTPHAAPGPLPHDPIRPLTHPAGALIAHTMPSRPPIAWTTTPRFGPVSQHCFHVQQPCEGSIKSQRSKIVTPQHLRTIIHAPAVRLRPAHLVATQSSPQRFVSRLVHLPTPPRHLQFSDPAAVTGTSVKPPHLLVPVTAAAKKLGRPRKQERRVPSAMIWRS